MNQVVQLSRRYWTAKFTKTVSLVIVLFWIASAAKDGSQLLNLFIFGTFSPFISRSAPILLLRLSDEYLEQLLASMPNVKNATITFRVVHFIVGNLFEPAAVQ